MFFEILGLYLDFIKFSGKSGLTVQAVDLKVSNDCIGCLKLIRSKCKCKPSAQRPCSVSRAEQVYALRPAETASSGDNRGPFHPRAPTTRRPVTRERPCQGPGATEGTLGDLKKTPGPAPVRTREQALGAGPALSITRRRQSEVPGGA